MLQHYTKKMLPALTQKVSGKTGECERLILSNNRLEKELQDQEAVAKEELHVAQAELWRVQSELEETKATVRSTQRFPCSLPTHQGHRLPRLNSLLKNEICGHQH